MEPFLRRVSARWPVIFQATTWTVLLMFTVAVASFAPELAFVSTVSSSCGGGDGFVKIPMDFPGESVCVPSHMVKRSRFDLFVPSIFAGVSHGVCMFDPIMFWDRERGRCMKTVINTFLFFIK